MYFNQIDEKRRTAIYVRISTAMQKTDRQVEELVAFAKSNRLNFDEVVKDKGMFGEFAPYGHKDLIATR